MALVVEDGTGLADAESYVTVAAADAYWAGRTHDERAAKWAGADVALREGALREASAFVDYVSEEVLVGIRSNATQALAWPRVSGETDDDGNVVPLTDADGYTIAGVPAAIATATMDIATQAQGESLVTMASEEALSRYKVGDVEGEFRDGHSEIAAMRTRLRTNLARLLRTSTTPNWHWR